MRAMPSNNDFSEFLSVFVFNIFIGFLVCMVRFNDY